MSSSSRTSSPPEITPGAQRPSFDPLSEAAGAQWEELPAGTPVAMVLGHGGHSAARRRVVHGEVVAYAVRHRDYLDVQLRSITTWFYGSPPEALEALDPEYLGNFRVAIVRSVRDTLDRLRRSSEEGRSQIEAAEVPFRRCWNCRRQAHEHGKETFCPACGQRLSVGSSSPPPRRPPASASPATCPACWRSRPEDGRHCPGCGHDRRLGQMASVLGARGGEVRLLLTEGRRRRARLSARLVDLAIERLYRRGHAQLVATVEAVRLERPADIAHPPAPSDRFRVTLQVDESMRAALQALEGGDRLRASEVKAPCPGCERRLEGETPPHVLGRHCSRCGVRRRLFPHPDWPVRAQPADGVRVLTHKCGAPVRKGVDVHCSGCGAAVEGYRARSSRFAKLS